MSVYILCRALIEIIRHVPADSLGEDIGEKIEDMLFSHIKSADPDLIVRSTNQQDNMELFAQLAGWL